MTNEDVLKVIQEAKASGITELNLSGKGLTVLPPEIGQLTKLERLDLSDNDLTALPSEICQMMSLYWLHLSRNRFADVPPEIFKMTQLTHLNLSNNKLTELPLELFKLTNLIQLYLYHNTLSKLPPAICQLTHLETLDLNSNELAALPQEIGQLTNLTRLKLASNNFDELPPEICQLPKLKELDLRKTPLVSPPLAIAEQGIEAMRNYFILLQKEGRPLNEVKLLLVGDGEAGKTSLVRRLLDEAFNQHEDATHGISIRSWAMEANQQEIKVNIWDFGGQEIMHATHQFFLSKRSLYVLVLDGRKDERPEYWLRHIESFGGDSPVLVVLNKQDSNPAFDLDRLALLRKFPGIRQFFRTSCKTGEGIAQFKEALIKELAQVPMIGIRWPQSWFRVKQSLIDIGRSCISHEEYDGLCAKAGVAGEENRSALLDFLHDLGVFIHFKDYILNTTYVLNPDWITNAIYKLINAEQTVESKGRLRLDSLGEILPAGNKGTHTYPLDTHAYIIELMKKFQLCWRIDEETVLIPQLLPVPQPKFSFDESSSLRFVLHYPHFLPPSVMPRFMVKVHRDIKADQCWRTGVVLVNEEFGVEALVKVDNETRKISIFVNGLWRKDYFAVLLLCFREINSSFEHLNVNELVSMPDAPDVTARYSTLIKLAAKGMDEYLPDDSDKVYSVKALLGLVQFGETDKEQEKIFDTLERIEGRQIESEKSFTEKAQSIVDLKPTFFGITLNVNALFETASDLYKKWLVRRKKRAETHQQVP
jgi:internalin A